MSRPLRHVHPGGSGFEITTRVLQSRYLIPTGAHFRSIAIGIMARAKELYPIELDAFGGLSNHMHWLLGATDVDKLAGSSATSRATSPARPTASWTGRRSTGAAATARSRSRTKRGHGSIGSGTCSATVQRKAYRLFVAAYREASARLRAGELTVEFPPGCFPPAGRHQEQRHQEPQHQEPQFSPLSSPATDFAAYLWRGRLQGPHNKPNSRVGPFQGPINALDERAGPFEAPIYGLDDRTGSFQAPDNRLDDRIGPFQAPIDALDQRIGPFQGGDQPPASRSVA